MSAHILDNPMWHALRSHQQHLAIHGGMASRCQPDVAFGAAVAESSAAAYADLADLVSVGETIALFGGSLPDDLPGWQAVRTNRLPQMICETLQPADPVDAIPLSAADVPEMLELVALAQPGPFLPRTIELGVYLGIRVDDRLVAMAGERLHPTGFCEVSAVCTHPDYRGRGYASGLTARVAQGIFERGETPFLTFVPDNHKARRVYAKLGFRQRTEIPLHILQRI